MKKLKTLTIIIAVLLSGCGQLLVNSQQTTGKCVTGKRCGATCISTWKKCHYGNHRRFKRKYR